ncbi:MAG TPA: hypothetical protein VNQ99_10835 [Xanthobacteraceae bacterium]|nr:hypothetical protein [Xanthobacteraceae bacterium]
MNDRAACGDPYSDDPFFQLGPDSDWNACIGRQGEEENYLDGYIEAAIELVDAVIEKQLFGKRDTLVLPILYTARHAIEISLKFAGERLFDARLVRGERPRRNHDIRELWERLNASAIGDEKLSNVISALEPFVRSVTRIDSDGQELRYHRNRDDDPSLENYALANLQVIQASLRHLEILLRDLQHRTNDFLSEHLAGTHTNRCSRKDLVAIARLMPPRDAWLTSMFDEQKALVKARFALSGKQFSIALTRIQENREMRAILGMESPLLHLTDNEVVAVIEQWRRLHPKQRALGPAIVNAADTANFDGMSEEIARLKEVIATTEHALSPAALAELEVMFYLGRDGGFVEQYEDRVERKQREHAAAGNSREEIRHLIQKTNLLQCVQVAAIKLGCLTLAERLKNA